MIQFFSNRINNKKGFTLVELLVVIAIMGILLTVAIPRLGQYRKDAQETRDLADAAAIYNALSTYLVRNGPEAFELLNVDEDDLDEYLAKYMVSMVPEFTGGRLLVNENGYKHIEPVTVGIMEFPQLE